jgi:tetratricopeptide (TPR) repeat protein
VAAPPPLEEPPRGPAPASDPFAAPLPPPAPAPSSTFDGDFDAATPPLPPMGSAAKGAEDLELLYGDGGSPGGGAAGGPGGAGGYKVRRRSGKVFGPFEADQVVSMVQKGELLGNEDVSLDGGAWKPIGAVERFAEAMRALTSADDEPAGKKIPGALAGVPFGDRMAFSKVTGADEAPREGRRWVKFAVAGGAVALILLGGASGALTRHGLFYYKLLRGKDEAGKVAQLAGQVRTQLAADDLSGDRQALALAEQALAADDREPVASALQALAVAALERRHAAMPAAVQRARALAATVLARDPDEPPTLVAQLAVASLDGAGLPAAEAAIAKVKGGPDPDTLDLLADAALARGDAAKALELGLRLEAAQPNTARAARALGVASAAKGDAEAARGWFEKALARVPGHLPTRLEQAALAEATGDFPAAATALEPLLAEANKDKLGPAERARALVLRGALLGRRVADAAAADEAYEAAVAADPRLTAARVALARHRLKRGDPAKALAATEPVAAEAAGDPALAAIRARALAAAGRALDASQLVDAALAKAPGNAVLLAAKGAVLEAQAKPSEALKVYTEASQRAPGDVGLHVAIARLAIAAEDLPTAERELETAVKQGPRDPAAQSTLGDLRATKGDAAGAEAAYRAALELDPEYPGAAGAQRGAGRAGAAAQGRGAGAEERRLQAPPRHRPGAERRHRRGHRDLQGGRRGRPEVRRSARAARADLRRRRQLPGGHALVREGAGGRAQDQPPQAGAGRLQAQGAQDGRRHPALPRGPQGRPGRGAGALPAGPCHPRGAGRGGGAPLVREGGPGRQAEPHAALLPGLRLQGAGPEGPRRPGVQGLPRAQAGRRRPGGHQARDRGPGRHAVGARPRPGRA